MKPYSQFTSTLNTFRATLIDESVIGCDFMFNVYNLNTNLIVCRLDGSDGSIRPLSTEESISANELRELAALCTSVFNKCEQFQ
jgi:hypothetical protein